MRLKKKKIHDDFLGNTVLLHDFVSVMQLHSLHPIQRALRRDRVARAVVRWRTAMESKTFKPRTAPRFSTFSAGSDSKTAAHMSPRCEPRPRTWRSSERGKCFGYVSISTLTTLTQIPS
jgi:hypothetical protein